MKKQRHHRTRRRQHPRSKTSRRPSSPFQRLTGLETLEVRQVLAANVLATGTSLLRSPGVVQELDMTVTLPAASTTSEAVLSISVSPMDGSSLDPAAVEVVDAAGDPLSTLASMNDIVDAASRTTVSVPAGEYTVRVFGEGPSTGEYVIDVSLVGDVDSTAPDQQVSEFETLLTSAAVVQTLGTGNPVTTLFYEVNGIDLAVDQADAGMDANGDGRIDQTDLAAVEQNAALGVVNVDLQVDGDPPLFSSVGLLDDTGSSNSDNITTDPTLLVELSDASPITSIVASLNGGANVDITDVAGDVGATGSFQLDTADLELIAGGPLPDGVNTISMVATDDLDNVSDPAEFSFTLINNNVAPTSAGVPDQAAMEDSPYSIDLRNFFTDANLGDVLTFSGTAPSWLNLNSDGRTSGIPLNADVGTATVSVTATDSQGQSASDSFAITVANTNDAPELINPIPEQFATEDSPFSFDVNNFFSDPDVGDALTYSFVQADGFDMNGNVINGSPLPAWLMEDSAGTLSGTPGDGDGGSITIGVIAVDSIGETGNALFTLTVTEANDPPIVTTPIADQMVNEDQAFSLDLSSSFADPENGPLTFSIPGLPAWLTLNSTTGLLQGTPGDADVGAVMLDATATDEFNASVVDSFSLTVVNINDVPVVNDQSFSVDPNSPNGTVVGTIVVTDDDVNETLTFAVTGGNPNNAFVVAANTGVVSVADASQLVDNTTETITIQVTDSASTSDTATITITISSNFPPVANDDGGFSVNDNATLDIDVSELLSNDTDQDNNTLTVQSVTASAQGAAVQLSGTTVSYDPRSVESLTSLGNGESLTDTFTYTVSDGFGGTDTATVSVVVNGIDVVVYRLEVVDTSGNPVNTLDVGQSFELVALVQDIQVDDPQGVFSAFVDVEYTVGLASVTGNIQHSTTYPSGTSGTNTTPGLLDEVGGVDGVSPLGGAEFEVFRQQFTATAAGTLTFSANETEDSIQHPTLIFGDNINLPSTQITFGAAVVTIGGGTPAPSSAGAFATNSDNPFDVNNDLSVSPLDALLVINAMEQGSTSADVMADVNADGGVSPIDALLVINQLVVAQSPSASNGVAGSPADVAEQDFAAALDSLFAELGDDFSDGSLSVEELQSQLSQPMIDAINQVLEADEEQQDDLWAQLAADLATELTGQR